MLPPIMNQGCSLNPLVSRDTNPILRKHRVVELDAGVFRYGEYGDCSAAPLVLVGAETCATWPDAPLAAQPRTCLVSSPWIRR
jgi:hypothetical protein